MRHCIRHYFQQCVNEIYTPYHIIPWRKPDSVNQLTNICCHTEIVCTNTDILNTEHSFNYSIYPSYKILLLRNVYMVRLYWLTMADIQVFSIAAIMSIWNLAIRTFMQVIEFHLPYSSSVHKLMAYRWQRCSLYRGSLNAETACKKARAVYYLPPLFDRHPKHINRHRMRLGFGWSAVFRDSTKLRQTRLTANSICRWSAAAVPIIVHTPSFSTARDILVVTQRLFPFEPGRPVPRTADRLPATRAAASDFLIIVNLVRQVVTVGAKAMYLAETIAMSHRWGSMLYNTRNTRWTNDIILDATSNSSIKSFIVHTADDQDSGLGTLMSTNLLFSYKNRTFRHIPHANHAIIVDVKMLYVIEM